MLKYQKLGGWSKFERICFILPRIPLIVILSDRQKMLKIWRKSPTLIRGPCLVLLLLILTLKYAGIMYTPQLVYHNVKKSVVIATCCLNVNRQEPLPYYVISCIINRFFDWDVRNVNCTNTLYFLFIKRWAHINRTKILRNWHTNFSDCYGPMCETCKKKVIFLTISTSVWEVVQCKSNLRSYRQGTPHFGCLFLKERPELCHRGLRKQFWTLHSLATVKLFFKLSHHTLDPAGLTQNCVLCWFCHLRDCFNSLLFLSKTVPMTK